MERLTYRDKKGEAHLHCYQMCADAHEDCDTAYEVDRCQRYVAFRKLADYEDAEEQGLLLWLSCKVGDTVYLIDRAENNKFKVYEGKWERVSRVQTLKDGPFEICGVISYDVYDCFYNDGRTMKDRMYVGQESTKIGEVVFLTREEAEAKLKKIGGSHE